MHQALPPRFGGSVADAYDRRLGPILFAPYARDLARRLIACTPDAVSVLEIACGTGILTRAIRAQSPRTGIVATDLSSPMLDYARTHCTDLTNVDWQIADACSLPFPSSSFGAIVCQFGAMFFSDRGSAFAEAARVLVPGGVFLLNVWDRISENPPLSGVRQALGDFGVAPMIRFLDVAYGFHRTTDIGDLLERHGFVDPVMETVTLDMIASSPSDLALAIVEASPLRDAVDAHGTRDHVFAAMIAALERIGGAHPFRSTMQAIVVMARAGS